jgi:hypothetical protein
VTHVAVDRTDLGRRADPYEAGVAALWAAWTERLGAPRLEVDSYALYGLPPATKGATP